MHLALSLKRKRKGKEKKGGSKPQASRN